MGCATGGTIVSDTRANIHAGDRILEFNGGLSDAAHYSR